jgi:hypothetical protein
MDPRIRGLSAAGSGGFKVRRRSRNGAAAAESIPVDARILYGSESRYSGLTPAAASISQYPITSSSGRSIESACRGVMQ